MKAPDGMHWGTCKRCPPGYDRDKALFNGWDICQSCADDLVEDADSREDYNAIGEFKRGSEL